MSNPILNVLVKSTQDESFRQILMSDPHTALMQEGIQDPQERELLMPFLVNVLQSFENVPSPVHIVLMKTLSDESFRKALVNDPTAAISNEGIRNPDEINLLQQILLPALRSMSEIPSPPIDEMQEIWFKELKEHFETLTGLRAGLQATITQMLIGYSRTMLMYSISFYIGIGLIIAAVVFAFLESEPLLPIVFAGLGTVDIIGYFVVGPPQRIQESRANLAQLQAAYFIWYQDFRHWGSYLNNEFTKYQNNLVNAADYHATLDSVSRILMKNTIQILNIIEVYVERGDRPEVQVQANSDILSQNTQSETAPSEQKKM